MIDFKRRDAEDKDFEACYNASALTIVGLSASDESLEDYADYLVNYAKVIREGETPSFIVFTGKQFDDKYKLTGKNAYQDGLIIVVVDPCCIDLKRMILKRWEVSGEWFDDVVDNNAKREKEKK